MNHLKMITSERFPTPVEVTQFSLAHPQRRYLVDVSSYELDVPQLKDLINNHCSIRIKKSDAIPETELDSLVEFGKDQVLVMPEDFDPISFMRFIQKGAKTILNKTDSLFENNVAPLIEKGKERVTIVGTELSELELEDFLTKGASVFLTKEDMDPFAISRLAKLGEDRLQVQVAGLSDFRINDILENKATIVYGEGCKFPKFLIERKVKKFKAQIHLSTNHYEDTDWLDKMETLGAILV